MMPRPLCLVLLLGSLAIVPNATAQCINRFTARSEGTAQIVTLLTGKLTYQNAQALAAAIRERRAAPLELVDDNGKALAKEYGELKIVRPMPVSCDGNPSGVVMVVTFMSFQRPAGKVNIRFDPKTIVVFEESK